MGTTTDIIMQREQELKDLCIGKEITEARNKLGHWWILCDQTVTPEQGIYVFRRAGYGRLAVKTSNKNIVERISYALFS